MASSERFQAMGRYEVMNKEFKECGIRMGASLAQIREETNILITGKDILDVDIRKIKTLLEDFSADRDRANELVSEMALLKDTYGL